MLVTLRRKLPVDLDADELRTVLMAASSDEWRPAVLDQQRYFLSLAGIGDSVDPDDFTATRSHSPRSRSEVAGDVFFKDGFILYVTLGDVGRIVRNEYGHLVRFLKRGEEKLEIGVIGEDEENAISKLDEFSDLIVDAIKSSLDGRKTHHIDFNWVEVEPSRTRIEDIVESSKDETGLEFRPLNLDDDLVEGSTALADEPVREVAILISKAVFLRQKEALERKGEEEKIKDAINKLQEFGLVSTEYLLECQQNGTRISRFSNTKELDNPTVANLICASCGNKYEDEALHEGYSLSDIGRKLIQSSHWMTVWVSNLLVELGVPKESIIWNVSESGEEVDLIVEFLGQLWIFELKDKEFGAGDAHPFNYRRVRYGADLAVIITADKVSKDAKRVFEELAGDDMMRNRTEIVYVEGLSDASKKLRKVIEDASMRYAKRRLSAVSDLAGYDLSKMLEAKYEG